ncbi:MAG: hypothetical protein R6W76_03820 [Caldilinea sp.]
METATSPVTLTVSVQDGGRPVAGAIVRLTDARTGFQFERVTDDNGRAQWGKGFDAVANSISNSPLLFAGTYMLTFLVGSVALPGGEISLDKNDSQVVENSITILWFPTIVN